MDASHVYVRASALGCFHSLISHPNLSEGADRVAGQLRGEKVCPFSGVTNSGRIWRKVPESDARSVGRGISGELEEEVGEKGTDGGGCKGMYPNTFIQVWTRVRFANFQGAAATNRTDPVGEVLLSVLGYQLTY